MNPIERLRSAARSVREAIPDQRKWYPPEVRAAERCMEEGRYADAEEGLSRLLAELDADDAVRPHHGHMLVCLASARLRQDKLALARESAERAIDLLGGEELRPSTDLSAARELLGRIELEEGNYDGAEQMLRQALATQEEARPLDLPAIAERSFTLAEALELGEKPEEAMSLLESSRERCEEALGEMHTVTAKCLLELGECQSRSGRHTLAMQSMDRALRIHQTLFGNDAEVVIRNLQLLAVAAQGAGDYETAANYYERALSLRERQLGARANGSVEILMDLAGVESEMGRFGRAAERLQQAIGKAQVERLVNLPQALEKLAVVYMLSGRLTDAGINLAKARDLYDVNPDRFRKEIAANEEIYAQLRSYYRVETSPPVAAARKEMVPEAQRAAMAAVPEVREERRGVPQFEVFDEVEEVRPPVRSSIPPAPSPETNAIAMLAGLLSREHALSTGPGKENVWVPAAEWEKLLVALRGFETPGGVPAPVAAVEPPAPKGPAPLWGWDDLGFEFVHA